MKPRDLFVAYAMAVAATSALAIDRGKWLCSDCTIEELPTGQAIPAAGEVRWFIGDVVNRAEFPQVPGVSAPNRGWLPGDTVSICNGTSCMLLKFQAGQFVPLGPPTRDSGVGYRNSPQQGSNHSVSFTAFDNNGFEVDVVIEGRWVRDVMSIDDVPTFYGSPYFLITGITVTTRSNPNNPYLLN